MTGSQMQLEDWLDDLCARFIINLPEEDLSSVARICFQVEEAQWFYEDFIRPLDPSLPSMSLRTFCLRIFQHCPLLASFSVENHTRAFEEFLQYKTRVPVRGAILLNREMDSTVLVKGWKKNANWSFPRGKINKDEDDLDCAIREVWEETGFDLREAGLVPSGGRPKYIEMNIREQQMRLYVFRDVPMDTDFQPQTRKEISKIQWYKLSELPAFRKKGQNQGQNPNQAQPDTGTNANKFYMVAPFLVPLKKWVTSQKRNEPKTAQAVTNAGLNPHHSLDEAATEDDGWSQVPAPVPSMHTPSIDTLEGATNELQRLLKVQPPAQTVTVAPEDKARALLSILQVKDMPTPGPQNDDNSSVAQTPFEMGAGEVPQQPRNPHHHANNQGYLDPRITQPPPPPPPPFHLQQQQPQPPFPGPGWNGLQQPDAYRQPIPVQGFDGTSQHAPPAQPQPPFPPQMQSTSQQHTPNASMYNAHLATQNTNGHGPAPPMPPPSAASLPLPQAAQKAPLSGKSMALLNAFKRDIANSPQQQHREPERPVQNGFSQMQSPPFLQYPQQQQPTSVGSQPSELAAPTAAPKPARDGAIPTPGDKQHRSALLDMFKADSAGAGTPAMQPTQAATISAATGPGTNLLDALRRGTPSAVPESKPTPQARSTSLSMAELFTSEARPRQAPVTNGMQQPQQQQPHSPMRILQRGQAPPEIPAFTGQPGGIPSHSPYLQPAAQGQQRLVSPTHAMSPPSAPGPPAADQKNQLLSLFGKQPQPPPPQPAAEPSQPPTRKGSQTPMSPAEQTFLLDYLQSVTNTAPRH